MRHLFSWIILAILIEVLVACARPDYIDDPTQNAKSDTANQTQQCSLKFSKAQLCADLHWTQGPFSPDESEFTLKFWDATKGQITGPYSDPHESQSLTLSIALWMPSMGHGSSPVKIEKIEPGVYRVRRVYFIMSGDWEVRILLKHLDGAIEQQTLKLIL